MLRRFGPRKKGVAFGVKAVELQLSELVHLLSVALPPFQTGGPPLTWRLTWLVVLVSRAKV